jgi:predicted phosphodiesterase
MKRISNFLLILTLIVFGSNGSFGQSNVTVKQSDRNLPLTLPLKTGSVRFLAFGDSGSGSREQYQLAQLMFDYRKVFPYEFAIMMGDNIYGKEKTKDMQRKFESAYKPILDQDIKFYATLGNHDESNQRNYELFNMKGKEYYRLKKGDVSFYSLNSNYMDKRQIDWLENELSNDNSKWKIAFFHHPLYSSGEQHGSNKSLRKVIEPIFIKNKVDVVLAGHEHFYERVKPQNGIYYFISGAAGKLRKGDIDRKSPFLAKGFDSDLSFMLFEIWKNELYFQVISRTGQTVDSGIIAKGS